VETTEHRSSSPIGADEAEFIKAARTYQIGGFALLIERFRRELLAHCSRMVASYEVAQDMTQETFLRAWGKREFFQGRASLRTWLYRIATNACLDFLEKRRDRTPVSTELQGAGLAQRCCTCSRGPTASQMTHTSRRWPGRPSNWRSSWPSSTCPRGSGRS
jgi:Sigma-70 region 2